MRLATKFALAFFAVALLTAGIMLVLLRRNNVQRVREMMQAQQQTALLAELSNYYRQNSSWEGLLEHLGLPPLPENRELPGQRQTSDRNDPALLGDPPTLAGVPIPRFGLLDTDGFVIVPLPRQFEPGERVNLAEQTDMVPIETDGKTIAYLVNAPPRPQLSAEESAQVAAINRALLTTSLISTAVAVLVGIGLARVLTRPLAEITEAARRIADGDHSERVPIRSKDETGVLASAFNEMSDALARSERQRARMTAEIAHDLRAPLTVIYGYAESIRDGVLAPTSERLDAIHNEANHVLTMIDDLQALALANGKSAPLNKVSVDPAMFLNRVVNAFSGQAAAQNIALTSKDQLKHGTVIQADVPRMMRVLGNLVANALRHTPKGGEITLSATQTGAHVAIAVENSGAGISAEDLPHIFEQYYRGEATSNENDSSAGLGLAIAKSIVEAHGGTIAAKSEEGTLTCFTVTMASSSAEKVSPPN